MLRCGTKERPASGVKGARRGAAALAVVAAAVLAGCSELPRAANPIEWYRDATGLSQNDSLATRNTQNLEAGSKEPYPNLGSVPPPPTRVTTAAERRKLRQALAADRNQAKASNTQVESRQAAGGPPWPLLGVTAGGAPGVAATAGSPPSPAAESASPGVPAGATESTETKPEPGAGHQERLAARGSEAPPAEVPLTSPAVRELPTGEAPRTPPPPPALAAVPPPAQIPAPTPSPAIEPQPAPPPPASTALVSPAIPPPPPKLAMATPDTQTGPGYNLNRPGNAPGAPLDVAEIKFADGALKLTSEDEQRLARVARLFQEKGGTIRVVGYGHRGYGPDAAQQELASFSDAIQRARLVGQALAKLGLPQDKILVQAAPIGDGLGEDRAEVLLER